MKKYEIHIPIEYQEYLGSYCAVIFDSYCGEPIAYGYPSVKFSPEEFFTAMGKLGTWKFCSGKWFLISHEVTPQEAEKLYGKVTEIQTGPKGGFKTVTYGKTKFCVKQLDPRGILKDIPESVLY